MLKSLPDGLANTLLWSDELGYGWHAREAMDYDDDYWQSYVERDVSPIGDELTQARIDIVRKFLGHNASEVIDIGIGGGRFVGQIGCYGFDVNDKAIQWLSEQRRLRDPYADGCLAITCWDSLEHIQDPEELVNKVDEFVFVSMPIYKDQADCLKSKHYKPGEHLWYFTEGGLIAYMRKLGFDCLLVDDIESRIGREGITSFVFRRKQ